MRARAIHVPQKLVTLLPPYSNVGVTRDPNGSNYETKLPILYLMLLGIFYLSRK